jgi:cytochrome c-550 PedF
MANIAFAHGDTAPQAVDTTGLPELGTEWLAENPYRAADAALKARAIEIGSKGYNSNCARCHGLEVISGGLAPDLRYLEASDYGDEWFVERFRHGYTQNGAVKMPPFDGLLNQQAAWAIRTYIETRPDSDALGALKPEVAAVRDALAADADPVETAARLRALSAQVETLSGAPEADTPLLEAAALLDGQKVAAATEVLTIRFRLD